jgi:hypothetical protein
MQVTTTESGWAVIAADGSIVKDGFGSNSSAWSWIDRNSAEGRRHADTVNSIRSAYADLDGFTPAAYRRRGWTD